MSAQLAYEQILCESAANEGHRRGMAQEEEERQSMSITQFYASNITGKYGHLETIKPKLETHWKKRIVFAQIAL